MNILKLRFLILVSVFVACIARTGCSEEYSIVAVVEDEPITSLELASRENLLSKLSDYQGIKATKEQKALITNESLRSLIQSVMVKRSATASGVFVTDAQISSMISSIASDRKMDVPSFYDHLSKNGISIIDFKNLIKDNLLKQFLIEGAVTNVEISDVELQKQVNIIKSGQHDKSISDMIKIAELRIETHGMNKKDVDILMKNISLSLSNGVSFEKLLLAYPNNLSKNNNIGWVQIGQLDPKIIAVVLNVNSGAISEPVIVGDYVVAVKILDRKPAFEFMKKDEYEELIRSYMLSAKRGKVAGEYWSSLVSSYCVQINH